MPVQKDQSHQETGSTATSRLKGANSHVICLVEEQVVRLIGQLPALNIRAQPEIEGKPEFWRL